MYNTIIKMAKIANNKQIRQKRDQRLKRENVERLRQRISSLKEQQYSIRESLELEGNTTIRNRMNTSITMLSKQIDSIQHRIKRNL